MKLQIMMSLDHQRECATLTRTWHCSEDKKQDTMWGRWAKTDTKSLVQWL